MRAHVGGGVGGGGGGGREGGLSSEVTSGVIVLGDFGEGGDVHWASLSEGEKGTSVLWRYSAVWGVGDGGGGHVALDLGWLVGLAMQEAWAMPPSMPTSRSVWTVSTQRVHPTVQHASGTGCYVVCRGRGCRWWLLTQKCTALLATQLDPAFSCCCWCCLCCCCLGIQTPCVLAGTAPHRCLQHVAGQPSMGAHRRAAATRSAAAAAAAAATAGTAGSS